MLPSHHWARNFTIQEGDIESLTTLLLEKETPLSTEELASEIIKKRLQDEENALKERYKDARLYNPSESYEIGQKLIFPTLDFASAKVIELRDGQNPQYGDFRVARVQFDGNDTSIREFAIELTTPHILSEESSTNGAAEPGSLTVEDILGTMGEQIIPQVEHHLQYEDDLVVVARKWFPRDLILEIDEGSLNLVEAVLDINGGGPMRTEDILEQMGGISTSPMSLQEFSLNYVMNQDKRFDEVGPTGEVLWYLARMEPPEVQKTPEILHYTPIDYNRDALTPDMLALEADIADELTPHEPLKNIDRATITLIYPHRRAGTLPLNAKNRHIFPSARRTPRIWVTLVDAEDNEEFIGWVVPEEKYVYGMEGIYDKYSIPIGAFVTVSKHEEPGKIRVEFSSYRARTEWIRLLTPKNDGQKSDSLQFEENRRSIGVDYDDLMIFGADDLEALDSLVTSIKNQKRTLASLMRLIIPELGKLTPQGTVHARTIYSVVNAFRRCPPGPILATLDANPDFENVGGHYWKLAES